MVIDSFRGDFWFLSNMYASVIYIEGDRYESVEHAYQASKTLDPWERRMIRKAASPFDAKALGKGVKVRENWDDIKVDVMKKLVKKKFENPFLQPMLLATDDAIIVENNTWNDQFWGVCKGEGLNMLGKILMEVREEIKASLLNECGADAF